MLCVLCAIEVFYLDGCVRDDVAHFFVVPDIVGEGSDIEVSEQDAGFVCFGIFEVLAHFFDEVEFVCELGIFFGVGNVSSCGYVEVV